MMLTADRSIGSEAPLKAAPSLQQATGFRGKLVRRDLLVQPHVTEDVGLTAKNSTLGLIECQQQSCFVIGKRIRIFEFAHDEKIGKQYYGCGITLERCPNKEEKTRVAVTFKGLVERFGFGRSRRHACEKRQNRSAGSLWCTRHDSNMRPPDS